MIESDAIELTSTSPEETRQIGRQLGRSLRPGDVVLLHGNLGAGKTTIAQGIALGLGVTDYVQSPTFTLVSEHVGELPGDGRVTLYHLDLYRLQAASELESFGYDDFLAPVDGVSLIEWPERAGDWLPESYLLIEIALAGANTRQLRITAIGRSRPTFDHEDLAVI